MKIQAIQDRQEIAALQPILQGSLGGNLSDRSVIKIDPSYAKREHLVGGVGPGMFNGLGSTILIAMEIITTIAVTLAVGIATYQLKPTMIALGVASAVSALFYAFVKSNNPAF